MGGKKNRYTKPTAAELNEFKALLGAIALQYKEAELAQLYWEMHEMAKGNERKFS